jgi:hypothetical protein
LLPGKERVYLTPFLFQIIMVLRNAQRKNVKLRAGLQGPAGSGKTYSALVLAYGLTGDWSQVAVIDTEFHAADLYAHLDTYQVLTLEPTFTPERYPYFYVKKQGYR